MWICAWLKLRGSVTVEERENEYGGITCGQYYAYTYRYLLRKFNIISNDNDDGDNSSYKLLTMFSMCLTLF